MTKTGICILSMITYLTVFTQAVQGQKIQLDESEKTPSSQWDKKRIAYLGDSMTQKPKSGQSVYWEYLQELMGIEPYVYGISGHQWDDIYGQALKLNKEHGKDVDAIMIFAGTNDYNHNIPLGEFFIETTRQTNHYGKIVTRKYRTPVINDTTFCGRINKVVSYLKANYPTQQIIIMTPIHRGFAQFSETNIQPEESFANGQGLYIESYVNTLKEAAGIWSVPLIDLYSISGLYPMESAHARYFRNAETDLLHPNDEGNYRLAKTIQYQLLGFPSTFEVED